MTHIKDKRMKKKERREQEVDRERVNGSGEVGKR